MFIQFICLFLFLKMHGSYCMAIKECSQHAMLTNNIIDNIETLINYHIIFRKCESNTILLYIQNKGKCEKTIL